MIVHPDIIIPTCRDVQSDEINELTWSLFYLNRDSKIIVTGIPDSAAVNRNAGLNESTSEYVVMCDDDISGFYSGWAEELIMPLLVSPDIIYVSARLCNPNGTLQVVMGGRYDTETPIIDVSSAPSACVAFRKTDLRFDENFIGSGWEDTDFVRQLKQRFPHGRIVINNLVRMRHKNEMKNQLGENYQKNRDYYNKKWNCHET